MSEYLEYMKKINFLVERTPQIAPPPLSVSAQDRLEMMHPRGYTTAMIRSDLLELPKDEIDKRYNQWLEKDKQALEKNRLALVEAEKKLFFNREDAKANCKYWVSMEWVTIDEAVALALGKNPHVVSLDKIKAVKNQNHPFVIKYLGLIDKAQRKFYKHGDYSHLSSTQRTMAESYALMHKHSVTKVNLTTFVAWALKFTYDVFPDLITALQTHLKGNREATMPENVESSEEISVEIKVKKKLHAQSKKTYLSLIDALKEVFKLTEHWEWKLKFCDDFLAKIEKDVLDEEQHYLLKVYMLTTLLTTTLSDESETYATFKNQLALIDYMAESFKGRPNLGRRTLEDKFSRANNFFKKFLNLLHNLPQEEDVPEEALPQQTQ